MTARTSRLAPALGLTAAAVLVAAVGVCAMSFADESSTPSSTALAVLASTSAMPSAQPARVAPKSTPRSSRLTGPASPSAKFLATPTVTAAPSSPASDPVPSSTASGSTAPGSTAPKQRSVPGSSGTGSEQDARAVFDAINQARLAQQLPPLTWSSRLELSAQRHNQAMAAGNTLAHQVGDEGSLGQRENQAGIRWTFAAENIGWSPTRSLAGALGIQASMLAESAPDDAHRRNILSRDARAIGIAVLVDAEHGRLWLTEDFADVG